MSADYTGQNLAAHLRVPVAGTTKRNPAHTPGKPAAFIALKDAGVQLLTHMRKGKNKSPARQQMRREMHTRVHRRLYRERGQVVEPMQGLVKELFDLERCWMRGNETNRWLFAAMGIAVQMAQRLAFAKRQSTWNIRRAVLGT